MNIGTDVQAWLWLIKAVVLLLILAWMVPDAMRLVQGKVGLQKHTRNLVLKGIGLIVAILALFVFFGPGKRIDNPDVHEDGHRKVVEARPAPPAERPEAKKDSYLKAVDDGPEADREAANNYLKIAIERNKP